MIARFKTWWHARKLRALRDNTYAAAAAYTAARARYESAVIAERAARREDSQ